MLALQIKSMKQFMSALLQSDAFDAFLLEEASVAAACTYAVDGHVNRAFFSSGEPEEDEPFPDGFVSWKSMRGFFFDLIKGKRAPLQFRFVLHLPRQQTAEILSQGGSSLTAGQVKAFVLTVRYDGTKAMLLTGVSLHTFLPDKEPDILWDAALKQFLAQKEIACEEL